MTKIEQINQTIEGLRGTVTETNPANTVVTVAFENTDRAAVAHNTIREIGARTNRKGSHLTVWLR